MRVGPIGWAFNSIEEVLKVSKDSALCTHNHKEGIKGAQAIASCIFLARKRASKEEIKCFIENSFGYNINISMREMARGYTWNATCQQTVPQAIVSFLESKNFEDCIRNAVSLGGDSDTIACMAGSISEAFWGIPVEIANQAYRFLPPELVSIITKFEDSFGNNILL
jgi:ADP-ribosylglycohydrolase